MTNRGYEDAVIASILRKSSSKDYNEAKREWSYQGEVVDHGPINQQQIKKHCQACGHAIRWGFFIHNKKNGNQMEIGSECIGNFSGISPGALDSAKKKLVKQQEQTSREETKKIQAAVFWKVVNPIRKAIYDKHLKIAQSRGFSKFEFDEGRSSKGYSTELFDIRYDYKHEDSKVPTVEQSSDAYAVKRNRANIPKWLLFARKYKVRVSGLALRALSEVKVIEKRR